MSDIDPEKLEEGLKLWGGVSRDPRFEVMVAAARAHLATLPRFKEVDVVRWHAVDRYGNVLTPSFATESELLNYAKHNWTCAIAPVRLTGTAKVKVTP